MELKKGQGMMPPEAKIIDIDSSLIRCDNGLNYNNGTWTNASGSSVNLSDYGINFDGTGSEKIATFSSGLASANQCILQVGSSLTIVLNNPISLFSTHSAPLRFIDNTSSLKINGNSNTFKTETSTANKLIESNDNVTLTLKDVTLILNANLDSGDCSAFIVDKLVLDNSTVEISVISTSTGNGVYALKCKSINDGYEVVGALAKGDTPQVAKPNADGVYQINDPTTNQMVNAKYVIIRPKKQPAPTPDPGKKDESCEKVIGPTWHWNNTKGVCEEYATVGTSTR